MCNDKRQILVLYDSPIKTGEEMRIKLRMSNSLGFVSNVTALFNRKCEEIGREQQINLIYNEEESTEEYSEFTGYTRFDTPGYRTFVIELKLNGEYKHIKYDSVLDEAIITEEDYPFWEMFVYNSIFETQDWIKGGIVYHIYVDTFNSKDLPEKFKGRVVKWDTTPKWRPDEDGEYRNNQFYGGNIKGIIEKLPYIKSLGTTLLYVSPIFESPSSNKYDISDYDKIDEMFGDWDDVKELHEKANALGMYLMLDCVFNHSSIENRLLKECPEMYDWIVPYIKPKCWWDYEHLPEFNKKHPSYWSMLEYQISKNNDYTDGYRIDVADCMPDTTLKLIRRLSKGRFVCGEVWKNGVNGEFKEFLYGDELDGLMNYQFANAIYRYVRWGNYVNFRQIVKSVCKLYPPEALAVSPIFLTSHDTPRKPNILVGDFMQESPKYENVWDMEKNSYWYDGTNFNTEKFRTWEFHHDYIPKEKRELAFKLERIAVFMQYTLPGLPSIFAGDEAGVTGYKDPFNRKTFPWDNIDERRYDFYCTVGKFRTSYRNLLAEADFKILDINHEMVMYRRDSMIFIVNRTEHQVIVPLEIFEEKKVVFYVGDGMKGSTINPYSAIAII